MQLYPLKFDTIYKHKVWGGRTLEKFYKNLPKGSIGESWLLSAFSDDDSIVLEGPLAGKTLTQLINQFKEELLGIKCFQAHGFNFPLLIKILDASDWLSLQVHPEDGIVSGTVVRGKEEAWYVLEASVSSEIILGLKEGVNQAEYKKMLSEGDFMGTPLLNHFVPQKGDLYLIEPGVVHAIGKGILILEVQQALDTTYRIYDWDRSDQTSRPLHREEAFEAIKFPALKQEKLLYQREKNKSNTVISRSSFSVNYFNISGILSFSETKKPSFSLYICIEGTGAIYFQSKSYPMRRGDLLMVPSICVPYEIHAEKALFLEVYI